MWYIKERWLILGSRKLCLQCWPNFNNLVLRCKFERKTCNQSDFVLFQHELFFNCYTFVKRPRRSKTTTQGIGRSRLVIDLVHGTIRNCNRTILRWWQQWKTISWRNKNGSYSSQCFTCHCFQGLWYTTGAFDFSWIW